MIKPVVERAADKWAKAVHVVKYDVENEDAAQFKAMLHDELGVKISALPTLILLKDGRHVGELQLHLEAIHAIKPSCHRTYALLRQVSTAVLAPKCPTRRPNA